jgi:glyoxylase-like metal-dependent hydrolase (beta-lactamase superfamily II)
MHGWVTPVFPNARVWAQSLEIRESHDETNRAHGVYTGDSLDRLQDLGLVVPVDGTADVTPRVRVFLTGGHTRGHQGTLVQGGDGRALVHLGDVLVTHAHTNPAWVSALDDFPLDTIKAKREWFGRAARQGWWLAFSHDVAWLAAQLDPQGELTATRLPSVAGETNGS